MTEYLMGSVEEFLSRVADPEFYTSDSTLSTIDDDLIYLVRLIDNDEYILDAERRIDNQRFIG